MKIGLNTKSGFRKFLQAREYHTVANRVHRHVQVAFTCDHSYPISYYSVHSLYRIESLTKSSFSLDRVDHRNLVGFSFVLNHICELDSAHELEDIKCRVKKTAHSLFRCWLSCIEAFPSSDTKGEWAVDVRNQACSRTEAHPNLLRQVRDEEARVSFCYMWHDFTRIFSSHVAA